MAPAGGGGYKYWAPCPGLNSALKYACAQAGKVEKFIKSEEAPKDNTGPVKVVTANTFDEIQLGGKDVLVAFYEQVSPSLCPCVLLLHGSR